MIKMNDIQDIEKYFTPRGPKFQFSESFLRSSMYYQLLNSMQSVNMKKLIIQKSPSEILQTPYYEEKLYQERIIWELIKQRFMIDTYLPQSTNLVPELDTFIPSHLFTQIQNWKILRNRNEELMSIQTIKYNEEISIPLFLLEETELTLRNLSSQLFNSGDPEYYIAKQTLCFVQTENLFNFLTRDQGYVVRMFNEKYITTLEDVIKMKKKGNQVRFYKEVELLGFFQQWLSNLEKYETKYNLYHSNISPQTLIQTMSSNTEYKLFNFQNLISGCDECQILRTITDEELMFIPPEIITRFLSNNKQSQQKQINMFQADLYSLCMVILYMATLGDSLTEFMKVKDEIFNQQTPTEKITQKNLNTNESSDTNKSIISDITMKSFIKSDSNISNTLTNNYTTKEKKSVTVLNTSNLNISIANKPDQKIKTQQDVVEKTFESNLNEGQNIARIIENYLNSKKADVFKEMYPILIFLIKKIILEPNPSERPNRQQLMSMITENTRQQLYEDSSIIRYCYSEFQQVCKINSDQEKKISQVVPKNTCMKAIIYNKLSLFPKTIDLLQKYLFRIDNLINFEDTRVQIDSLLQLSIGYMGCSEIENAVSLLDHAHESISNKLSGQTGSAQTYDNFMFKSQKSNFSKYQQSQSQFYQFGSSSQLTPEQRIILNRYQNYSLYLKAYSGFLILDLKSDNQSKQEHTLYGRSLDFLNEIQRNIVIDDIIEKNNSEDISGYFMATILKLRLLIDASQSSMNETDFGGIQKKMNKIKQKLVKQKNTDTTIDQFYFELMIIQSESYLFQSRYSLALNILEKYQQDEFWFNRIKDFKDEYYDNSFKILKDQIILYTLQSDLSIVCENMESFQLSYQCVKRNFFGMITNISFSFCFFYDILEQLFHLIDLDSLKYDILQKMEKCLQFVYLHQYVPEKLDSSLNSFLDIKQSEELLFNPFIQFLIGKTFLGMESPRDREAGYIFLFRAYRVLRFTIEDPDKKINYDQGDQILDSLSNATNEIQRSREQSQFGNLNINTNAQRSKSNTNQSQNINITGLSMDQSQMFTSSIFQLRSQEGKLFNLLYNDLFMKQAEKLRMMILTKSYFFQQRVLENILYCIDVDTQLGQTQIIESFSYLCKMRPQRKLPTVFLKSISKKDKDQSKKEKRPRNSSQQTESSEVTKFEPAYIHSYIDIMRKAKLYIQFKKYYEAIKLLKDFNDKMIAIYIKNFDKKYKNRINKIQEGRKIEQILNNNPVEEPKILVENREFVSRMLMDQTYIKNHLALCYYGLKEFQKAEKCTHRLFQTERLDYLGPNYTIVRNIKAVILFSLDYRQLGIFQSSLMLIEIIDKVLKKVGHYPTVQKTGIVSDLQILKNIVLFETSQLELYYGFDEYKEQIMKQIMDDDEKAKRRQKERESEGSQRQIRRKSRPSIRSESDFNIQEQINEEEYNKFKMRGFCLQRQSQSLNLLINYPQIEQYKIKQIELTFLLSAILLELGRFGKAHLQFKKVTEFDYTDFFEQNIDNISQFQFLYEKKEVRNIKISFMQCQILMSTHQYTLAKAVIEDLIQYSTDLLKDKKENQQHVNPYYKQIYTSVNELMGLMKSMRFVIKQFFILTFNLLVFTKIAYFYQINFNDFLFSQFILKQTQINTLIQLKFQNFKFS